MRVGVIAKRTEKVITDNSPLILTSLGVVGTITTAYFAGKASFKAALILDEAERVQGEEATTRDKIEMLWKLYIPALGVGAVTVSSIILANRIGTRRAAAMASAFMLSERAFDEYREKVIEHMGKAKEQKVVDEIAQDRTDRVTKGQPIFMPSSGKVWCIDKYTDRKFESTMETLKKAQNDVNYQLLNEGFCSLNEFYSKAGLNHIPVGEEVGWNSDKLMELTFSSTLAQNDDGVEIPFLVMDFWVEPLRNFHRWH